MLGRAVLAVVLALQPLFLLPVHACAALYTTWTGIEVDKCASSWLIVRFVDKDAEFKVVQGGTSPKDGTPFDTPYAKLRRYSSMTTFDTIRNEYKIKGEALDRLALIIRDIELNAWANKVTQEAIGLDTIIRGLDIVVEDDVECMKKSWIVFDALHAALNHKTGENK
ncbi:MAG: chromate resistance protein ChrB domain-containing protein [Candidatus Eisenbacteria bacterium]